MELRKGKTNISDTKSLLTPSFDINIMFEALLNLWKAKKKDTPNYPLWKNAGNVSSLLPTTRDFSNPSGITFLLKEQNLALPIS